MSVPIINQGNVYGSCRDPKYTTPCLHEAEAHEFIYSDQVKAWVKSRLEQSNRFTSKSALNGAIDRNLELLHRFETKRRKATPVDHFGMDNQA